MFGLVSVPVMKASLPVVLDASEFLKLLYPPHENLTWRDFPTKVIFHDPATIVYWPDGVKTVVKCQPGDTFSKETGLMAAMLKRYLGNDNTYNKVINELLKDET